MLTKAKDVIFQCLWRHNCQSKPQKCSYILLDIHVCPHFEKGSATHASRY